MSISKYPLFGRVVRFFKENPGAVPIVGFQILLLVCAGLLIFGLGSVAESVAVVAYFLLVAGVLILLVSFVRNSNERIE
jgi:hypothetical protein